MTDADKDEQFIATRKVSLFRSYTITSFLCLSETKAAKFIVFFVKNKGAPVLVPTK
jgi:hypothetical protein